MEFSFTEEQDMIRESAESFLSEISSSERIREAMNTELGYDLEIWQRIAQEMVWPALHIPEEYGGMGLGYVDLVVLLEKMGKHLLCSPFFSTVCLATNALLLAGNEKQKEQYLTKIAEGNLTGTLAYTSKNTDWKASSVECTYQKQDDDFVLSGEFCYVPNGHSADFIILAAREENSSGQSGISLFIVDGDINNAEGLSRRYTATMDQTKKQAELKLNSVKISKENLLGQAGNAYQSLEKIIQLANIAVAAEQLGGAQEVLDQTVAYTLERQQFNRSIASFQAVKHKAADMMLKAECTKSAVYYAACIAQCLFDDEDMQAELPEAASLAKAYASEAYFFNAGCAIQLHGGVGFTWEYDIHLFFKRAKSSETFLGNSASHRENIASILLD